MSARVGPEATHALLRHLTLPVSAVTTTAGGRTNGFIVNSAQRASLVPAIPRISLYVSKVNFSHDLVYRSGILAVHLLRADQWEVVRRLGLRSGRDGEKFGDLELRTGRTGCPLLEDAIAAFECRVINAMDAGAATFFLADVVEVAAGVPGRVLTSDVFRAEAPEDVRRRYEQGLEHAQRVLEPLMRDLEMKPWPGASTGP